MLEIAQSDRSKGVFQKEIASNQGLSNKYLDHIISALKTSRLICNVKGKKSGYMLTRSPEEITVFDIHRAFESGICLIECLNGNYSCNMSEQCLTKGFWGQLNNLIINYLKSVTLADLVNQRINIEDFKPIKASGEYLSQA
jgi:Rrf2 family protein